MYGTGATVSFPSASGGGGGQSNSSITGSVTGGVEGDIRIRYFLPHTPEPEPEPIEGQWRNVKATANTLYENASDMAGAVRRMIMSGKIIKAKMSHYLTP